MLDLVTFYVTIIETYTIFQPQRIIHSVRISYLAHKKGVTNGSNNSSRRERNQSRNSKHTQITGAKKTTRKIRERRKNVRFLQQFLS